MIFHSWIEVSKKYSEVSLCLLASLSMESLVKFRSPQNISAASQQNSSPKLLK